MALKDIDTFVIVMLENRSFDHMCGYLNLAGPDRLACEGLQDDQAWRDQYLNDDDGGPPQPIHQLAASTQNIPDPPHEDTDINTQINTPTHAGALPTMGGFVKSYLNAKPRPHDRSPVMGYYGKDAVPVLDFFARNYAMCDHWYSPLPAGTQPNRLMAMAGESHIHHNVASPLDFPAQALVYDWLMNIPDKRTKKGALKWCSYVWGSAPFFSLMPRWWPRIVAGLSDQYQLGLFRRYEMFKEQWKNGDAIPDVVFIEPRYTDDPTPSFHVRNDDHCPTGISEGQRFLADIYNTLISNKELWQSTMLIVTYDEHGGFFDHVPPLAVPAQAGSQNFATTGVRVPAFVVSPYVAAGKVFSDMVDGTSVLQLLADRYTPGVGYSDAVTTRQAYFKPLDKILNNPAMTGKPKPIPSSVLDPLVTGAAAAALDTGEKSATAQAFDEARARMDQIHPDQVDRFGAGSQS